jgi:hypothetical protein
MASTKLASFTELVATAISNAATHAKLLVVARARVAAADEGRRRIERGEHRAVAEIRHGREWRSRDRRVPPWRRRPAASVF